MKSTQGGQIEEDKVNEGPKKLNRKKSKKIESMK
jgi:hypothetical protein